MTDKFVPFGDFATQEQFCEAIINYNQNISHYEQNILDRLGKLFQSIKEKIQSTEEPHA